MDKSRLEIMPGVWLDHRRAAYLEAERILCVADLHLGYAWAHRFSGQLMPLRNGEDLLSRLSDVCSFYKPAHLAILGDLHHPQLRLRQLVLAAAWGPCPRHEQQLHRLLHRLHQRLQAPLAAQGLLVAVGGGEEVTGVGELDLTAPAHGRERLHVRVPDLLRVHRFGLVPLKRTVANLLEADLHGSAPWRVAAEA